MQEAVSLGAMQGTCSPSHYREDRRRAEGAGEALSASIDTEGVEDLVFRQLREVASEPVRDSVAGVAGALPLIPEW